MGGIYIPDVSLPGDGDFELWIAVKKDGSFTYNVSGAWRVGNQKAVPVPAHGRLIDADNIDYPLMESEADEKWMHIVIDSAPTVIEAEEGE